MRRVPVVLALWLLAAGCARVSPATAPEAWSLRYPPEALDTRYPKGVHLARSAPLSQWTVGDRFDSEDACEIARVQRIDAAIDEARITHGDEAKYELPVRRAVNARCVSGR